MLIRYENFALFLKSSFSLVVRYIDQHMTMEKDLSLTTNNNKLVLIK